MKKSLIALGLTAAMAATASMTSTADAADAERVYVFDCGQSLAKDQSRWSPGFNIGVPIQMAANCYLVRHAKGLLLWDTGYPDAIAASPDGITAAGGASVAKRLKTLAGQLAEIGVKPADVTYVAISHTHGDHIGNLNLFPASTLVFQAAEYDWAFSGKPTPFPSEQKVMKLGGDHDVFGDGAVTIISTPGHTPGHQSLMVRLPKTGVVLMTGDAVHFRDNWDNARVPAMNVDREQTLASMRRLRDLMTQHNAQLWINHDWLQRQQIPYAPESVQ